MSDFKSRPARVSATQLAEMVVCERKAVFKAHYGWRPNAWRAERLSAGVRAHERSRHEHKSQRAWSAPRWMLPILALGLVLLLVRALRRG
jgi:hypothetical protein